MRNAAVLAALAVCTGCVVPLPLPSGDTPPDVAPILPVEFSARGPDTLVIVVRSTQADSRQGGMVVFDHPIFIDPEKLPTIAEQLTRKGMDLALLFIPGGTVHASSVMPVRELCIVSASGRTVSLLRRYGFWSHYWTASAVSAVDAVWRDQFAALVAQPHNADPLIVWRSGPCKYVAWTPRMEWTEAQRARVVDFLQALPLKK